MVSHLFPHPFTHTSPRSPLYSISSHPPQTCALLGGSFTCFLSLSYLGLELKRNAIVPKIYSLSISYPFLRAILNLSSDPFRLDCSTVLIQTPTDHNQPSLVCTHNTCHKNNIHQPRRLHHKFSTLRCATL
jgi:hypothetical protein